MFTPIIAVISFAFATYFIIKDDVLGYKDHDKKKEI